MKYQSIFITGCSHGGIGYATSVYLKDKGYQVFTSARAQADVDILKSEGFISYLVDVNNYEQVDLALQEILKRTDGTLDAVFNNAGFGQAGALEDLDTKFLKEQFETNVFSLHNITRKSMKIMRNQGYGKIIQHSSVLGLISMKYKGAYSASKYAVEAITDTMRLELKGTDIYMTSLNTGPITSKFRENFIKTVKNVEFEESPHKPEYIRVLAGEHKKMPFNEEAISMAKVVEKILLAKKPKPRYYITKATWIMGILKRVLSTSALDNLLKNR
jgi:short-subunit dehydrogenase